MLRRANLLSVEDLQDGEPVEKLGNIVCRVHNTVACKVKFLEAAELALPLDEPGHILDLVVADVQALQVWEVGRELIDLLDILEVVTRNGDSLNSFLFLGSVRESVTGSMSARTTPRLCCTWMDSPMLAQS